MPEPRTERDALGELPVTADALYGIYTARALENFPLTRRPVHAALIHAYGAVKLACARAMRVPRPCLPRRPAKAAP
jgi:aspartate ammonia-lyase